MVFKAWKTDRVKSILLGVGLVAIPAVYTFYANEVTSSSHGVVHVLGVRDIDERTVWGGGVLLEGAVDDIGNVLCGRLSLGPSTRRF